MKIRTAAAFVAGNVFAYALAVAVVAVMDSIKAKEQQQRQWSEERQRVQEAAQAPSTEVPGFGQVDPWINPYKWGPLGGYNPHSGNPWGYGPRTGL